MTPLPYRVLNYCMCEWCKCIIPSDCADKNCGCCGYEASSDDIYDHDSTECEAQLEVWS